MAFRSTLFTLCAAVSLCGCEFYETAESWSPWAGTKERTLTIRKVTIGGRTYEFVRNVRFNETTNKPVGTPYWGVYDGIFVDPCPVNSLEGCVAWVKGKLKRTPKGKVVVPTNEPADPGH